MSETTETIMAGIFACNTKTEMAFIQKAANAYKYAGRSRKDTPKKSRFAVILKPTSEFQLCFIYGAVWALRQLRRDPAPLK